MFVSLLLKSMDERSSLFGVWELWVPVMWNSVGLNMLMLSCWGHPFTLIHTVSLDLSLRLFESIGDVKRMPNDASDLLVKISANLVSLLSLRIWIRCFFKSMMVLGVMSGLKPVMMSEFRSRCQ